MIFESGDHGHCLVIIVGRTDSVKTGLTGDDFEEDPAIMAAAVSGDNLDILYGEGSKPIRFSGDFLRSGGRNEGQRCHG